MNIKITYNWLLEYLDTDADPYELQKFLSLSGPSIERVEKVGDDYVLDIEITSNRIDMASVFGIAQEATAILPAFGKKASLKLNPLHTYTFENLKAEPVPHKQLEVVIDNHDLVPRFTAMVFSNVQIKPAPNVIQQRLEMCDIKSINNVVDISNYIMLALGQPIHMFDYDKITGHKMIVRESKPGEKLVTLDDKEITLPGGDIVIEDGEGRLIDLCGIMGGANSAISNDTATIVFFVQTYNKRKIRKTSMTTGQRTVAATYFEKGLDTERVETAFVYGVELINQLTNGIADSPLYDVYPHPYKPKTISTDLSTINRVIGVTIDSHRVVSILENLGFKVEHHNEALHITIPSYRADDVEIKEDITEEVARAYGYHNLPENLPPPVYVKQPKEIDSFFNLQQKIKYYLKHIGLHEVMNYSMNSKELLEKLDLIPADHLKLANTISTEIEYMRTSLLPSLVQNIKENQGKKETLKLFEIAKTYRPRKGELPEETYRLGIVTNTSFSQVKGLIEGILNELNISEYTFRIGDHYLLSPNVQAQLLIGDKIVGAIGQLSRKYQNKMGITSTTVLAELHFGELIKHAKLIKTYIKTTMYATIKLDLTIKQRMELPYAKIKEIAHKASQLLSDIKVVSTYEDNLTLRFYFSSPTQNLTEEEAKAELEKIKSELQTS